MRSLKNFIKKIVFTFIKPKVEVIYSSYSQAGEDAIVNMLFNNVQVKNPSYLDIGVCHPDFCDNTYYFYKKGSRGVCVEANPELIENIKQIRPEDKVLNVGVSCLKGAVADFYTFDDPNLNTFDKEEALKRASSGKYKINDTVSVPLKTINEIIAENFEGYPDFISLDIEGLDLEVLKSLDYEKFPVPVICVETCSYSEDHIKPKVPGFDLAMKNAGYFIFADTYVNTIYVNEEWFQNINKNNGK